MKKIIVIVLALLIYSCTNKNKMTYSVLLDQMVNLEKLAVLPQDSERTKLESSYDRKSKYDAKTGKYIDWNANGDNFNADATPKEGDMFILANLKGPGCIFRLWSALADSGRVKIYIDGNKEPAIDLPFKQFFDCSQKYLNYPALCYTTAARGSNMFIPISFNKSCKILAAKKWGNYYQFNYKLFPKNTQLPSFSQTILNDFVGELKKTNDILQNSGEYPYAKNNNDKVIKGKEIIEPGHSKIIADIKGKYAIKSIRFFESYKDSVSESRAMRLLSIQAIWDDEKKPAIWSPLGDFFGTSPIMTMYKTYPIGVKKGEMYSYWYMPFDNKASFEITNNDNVPQQVEFEIKYGSYDSKEPLGRFHAKWHRNTFPFTSDRTIDWSLLRTTGKGRFVGVMLNVWNPKGGWWGEGDEKFFVDGEKFPSTFGTGSEDYFGYAWCDPHLFQKAYHAQSTTQQNAGWQTVCRWHISDNIPFNKGFDGYIEKYFKDTRPTQYACIAYWYQEPGTEDLYTPVPAEERFSYQSPYHFTLFKEPGAFEFEDMKVLSNTGSNINKMKGSDIELDKTSNNGLIDWNGKKDSDNTLTLAFNIDKNGMYSSECQLVKWPGLAIIQFFVDDKKLGEPIDTHISEASKGLYKINLGNTKLEKGEHKLALKLVGTNPENRPSEPPEVALDYIKFTKTANN